MVTLSWNDIHQMVAVLKAQLAEQSFEAIVGIARAGLVPAVMLSHILGVREFGVIDVRRTLTDDVDGAKHQPVLRGGLNLDRLVGSRVLLVDDVVGAGETMRAARARLAERCATLKTATLAVNERNLEGKAPSDVVDYCACVMQGWVVFPWEGGGCHLVTSTGPSHGIPRRRE